MNHHPNLQRLQNNEPWQRDSASSSKGRRIHTTAANPPKVEIRRGTVPIGLFIEPDATQRETKSISWKTLQYLLRVSLSSKQRCLISSIPLSILGNVTRTFSSEGQSPTLLIPAIVVFLLLLSSSMDKTVRLWSLSSKTCLKIFSQSNYVTCIQFNPVDDRYFISGSLDAKVRIRSIPDRQVVDWSDLHEMVTAACYTPDGQVNHHQTWKCTRHQAVLIFIV